jgi:hypothetical protein
VVQVTALDSWRTIVLMKWAHARRARAIGVILVGAQACGGAPASGSATYGICPLSSADHDQACRAGCTLDAAP